MIPVLLSVSEEYNLLRYLKKYDILNNDYKYKNNKKDGSFRINFDTKRIVSSITQFNYCSKIKQGRSCQKNRPHDLLF